MGDIERRARAVRVFGRIRYTWQQFVDGPMVWIGCGNRRRRRAGFLGGAHHFLSKFGMTEPGDTDYETDLRSFSTKAASQLRFQQDFWGWSLRPLAKPTPKMDSATSKWGDTLLTPFGTRSSWLF